MAVASPSAQPRPPGLHPVLVQRAYRPHRVAAGAEVGQALGAPRTGSAARQARSRRPAGSGPAAREPAAPHRAGAVAASSGGPGEQVPARLWSPSAPASSAWQSTRAAAGAGASRPFSPRPNVSTRSPAASRHRGQQGLDPDRGDIGGPDRDFLRGRMPIGSSVISSASSTRPSASRSLASAAAGSIHASMALRCRIWVSTRIQVPLRAVEVAARPCSSPETRTASSLVIV